MPQCDRRKWPVPAPPWHTCCCSGCNHCSCGCSRGQLAEHASIAVQMLLQAGASTTIQTSKGESALHIATAVASVDWEPWRLQAGRVGQGWVLSCSPGQCSGVRAPVHIGAAAPACHVASPRAICHQFCYHAPHAQVLLDLGADKLELDALHGELGFSALHQAAEAGEVELVQVSRNYGSHWGIS